MSTEKKGCYMNYLIIYLVCINLFGIFIMLYDKKKAEHHKWRVPEAHLFLVAAVLGSPGILMGMLLFRHKTKHLKFIIGIPAILIVQIYLAFRFFKL